MLNKSYYKSSPSFIVIGAGRSGTTWLYENLKKCNKIWLPPIKEIHYFDRNIKYPSPSFLYSNKFHKRVLGPEDYNKNFRHKMVRTIGKNLIGFNIKDLLWCFKYFFCEYNDDWYISLFNIDQEKITGDITPAYQLLDQDDVSKVYHLLPNAKIIFIIRNPIDRTWSQLRKNKQNKLTYEKIKNILKSKDMSLRNNYLYTINNWRRYYPKGQFMLCFFDDIINAPYQLLKDLLYFLSGENFDFSDSLQKNLIKSKINSAPSENMTNDLKDLIIKESFQNLKNLSEEIGGYSKVWYKATEEYLNENEILNKTNTIR